MPNVRLCCFPDCTTPVNRPHICCGSHWHSLPPRIKVGAQKRLNGWLNPAAGIEFVRSYLSNQKASVK